MNPDQISTMARMWDTVATNKEIAEIVGVSIPTLLKYARQNGLPSRRELTDEIRTEALKKFWKARTHDDKVARMTSMENPEKLSVLLPASDILYFACHAQKRDITIEMLVMRVLATIVNDDILSAVLDDADERRAA